MIKLNLKKQCAGSYHNSCDGIYIALRNDYLLIGVGFNVWQLFVERGDDLLMYEVFNTKKEAMIFGAKWVTNNLNK